MLDTQRSQRFLDWLGKKTTAGDRIKRNIFLLLFLALLSLLPLEITSAAKFWAPGVAALILLLTLTSLGGAAWLSERMRVIQNNKSVALISGKLPSAPSRPIAFLWQLITRLGLLFPAVVFFLFWTLLYIAAWAWDPGMCPADPAIACSAALSGIGPAPIFGDFLYFAVNMAFANPVPDILANSRLAHTMVTIEVISGIALATFYAGTFFGLEHSK